MSAQDENGRCRNIADSPGQEMVCENAPGQGRAGKNAPGQDAVRRENTSPVLRVFRTACTDPYENLAREEYLLRRVPAGEVWLYLWQNDRTVVIGRNQNAWQECRTEALEAGGGHLARRLSGGGAVYHDLGNLNFTFLARRPLYDRARQTVVIRRAVQNFGIHAEVSGRNDLEIDGKKFSGHAYHKGKNGVLHHGTLMLKVNEEMLERYLHVSMLKLHSKNVASVRSRIVNLTDIVPELDTESLSEALIASAEEVLGVKAKPCCFIDDEEVAKLTEWFADECWRYGKIKDLKYRKERRFSWGTVKVIYDLNDEKIADLAIYTDALDAKLFEDLPGQLIGRKINELDDRAENEAGDIIRLLKEEEHEI